jgi:hypothetical protein
VRDLWVDIREYLSREEFAPEIIDRLARLAETEPGNEKVLPFVCLLWRGFRPISSSAKQTMERMLGREVWLSDDSWLERHPCRGSREETGGVVGQFVHLSQMTIWRSLLLIYPAIDVQFRDQSESGQRFIHVLTDTEVSDGVDSFQHFPSLVEELTSHRATVRYEIHRVERCLTSLTHMSEGMYWPSPTDTREEIDRLAAPGSYDSIFILWPQRNLKDGTSVRSAGWGLGLAASRWSNNATYATIANTESWRWQIPVVGEVWLHEWLHGVCAYFAGRGCPMPDGDADGGARHGYAQSRVSGWTEYYRDLMTGNVLDEGRVKGIPLEAWANFS